MSQEIERPSCARRPETAGYLFLRIWREGQGYTIMAFDSAGSLSAMAFGKKNAQAWDNIHAALREKGIDSHG